MKSLKLFIILAVLLLSACNSTFEIGIEHSPDPGPTAVVLPSPTTDIVVPSPTLPPPSPTSPLPTSTLASPTVTEVSPSCAIGETVMVPFTGGINAVLTQNSYNGTVILTASGTGQASGSDYNDAFYIYADVNGNPIELSNSEAFLTIEGKPANELISGEQVQAYRSDHVYTFSITASGGRLAFGVNDSGADDNTGSYEIVLCQLPQVVNIFLIALEDNGASGPAVGCGDSAVAVQVEIPNTQGVLRAAMEALLSIKTQYYGESGLYNALYQSDLQVGGECDAPRIQAQLEQTVRQFPTITDVVIYINDKLLQDVLSLK